MLKNPVVRRFCKRKVSVIALIVLLLFILAGIFGPIVWRVDPIEQNYRERYASFSLTPVSYTHLWTASAPATCDCPTPATCCSKAALSAQVSCASWPARHSG